MENEIDFGGSSVRTIELFEPISKVIDFLKEPHVYKNYQFRVRPCQIQLAVAPRVERSPVLELSASIHCNFFNLFASVSIASHYSK